MHHFGQFLSNFAMKYNNFYGKNKALKRLKRENRQQFRENNKNVYLNGIQEVSGSIPLISTKQIRLESVNFRVFFAFTGMFYPEKLLNLHLLFLLKNGLVCNMSVIAQHVFFTKHRLFCANRRNLRPDNTLTYHRWCARSIQACLYPRPLHAS